MVGQPHTHAKYRSMCVKYLVEHRSRFEVFLALDDGETFKEYVDTMLKDGVWGGNFELKCLADALSVHIVVHQLDSPRWIIRSASTAARVYIQIGYTNGSHYDSVRSLSENDDGIPKRLNADGRAIQKRTETEARNPASKNERFVMQVSRCPSIDYVRHVLLLHNQRVDDALSQLALERRLTEEWSLAKPGEELPTNMSDVTTSVDVISTSEESKQASFSHKTKKDQSK
eukprot:g594.t1